MSSTTRISGCRGGPSPWCGRPRQRPCWMAATTRGWSRPIAPPRRRSWRAGKRPRHRLPRQHLDDRTQRLLLRNDRPRRPGRDPYVAAPPAVAPFGGTRPALGTNPIAFGFPTDGDPLVIDMGTSAFMGTDLQFRARLGTRSGASARAGRSADDGRSRRPARRAASLRWPEGGYKGFGLALAMDALGALTAGRGRRMRSAAMCSSRSSRTCSCQPTNIGAKSAGGST